MHPLFNIGPWSVSAYGVMLVLALATGTLVAVLEAERLHEPRRRVLRPALAGIACGLVGAKLWSVSLELLPMLGSVAPGDLFASNGLSVFGGLAGGALGVAAALRWSRSAAVRWMDVCAPGVALAIGIGRIGCLLAGCCYGRPTLFPIAVVYSDFNAGARPIGVPLHATQIYEAVLAVALAAALRILPADTSGRRAGILVLGYGAVRAVLDPLRADYRGHVGSVSAALVAAVACMVGGALLLALASRQRGSAPSGSDSIVSQSK